MSNVEDEPPHVMHEDAVNESSEQTSGSHGPTIGDITISTNEGQAIREAVRTIVRKLDTNKFMELCCRYQGKSCFRRAKVGPRS